MSELEKFSRDKHFANWSLQQETVAVEGTLQQDGDYYVIDRDPAHPGTLLRVRTGDVPHYEKTRTVPCIGGERQLYRILIKRGVPVERVSILDSDRIPVIARHSDTYSATFINTHIEPTEYSIVDYNDHSREIFRGVLQRWGDADQKDRTTQTLLLGPDNSAEAGYRAVQLSSTYAHTPILFDNADISMS